MDQELQSKTGSEPDDALFSIEQRGIDLVGAEARHGKPIDLFWMWMGSNLNIFYPVNGALVIYFGLSFSQSILVIVLGNLIFFGVGLTSLQGPKTGTSTFAISRAAYGQNGGRGLSLFNWATCVGFEASGLALIVLAGLALFAEAGVHATTGLKIVLLLVAMVLQAFLPVLGHQTIVTVQRYLAYLLIPLFVVMAIAVAGHVHISSLNHGGSWATVMVTLALVISAGGLSWANTGSDYSRYLPADADPRGVFWWSSLGGMIPAVLLEVLGAAIASIVSTASDPISGLPKALPGWVVTPYLFVAIITLFAVNTIDLYSSGLTLQAVGLKLKRWQCVIVDMIIATIVGGITIFNSDFNRLYSEILKPAHRLALTLARDLCGRLGSAARKIRASGPSPQPRRTVLAQQRVQCSRCRRPACRHGGLVSLDRLVSLRRPALQSYLGIGLQLLYRAVGRRPCVLAAGAPIGKGRDRGNPGRDRDAAR